MNPSLFLYLSPLLLLPISNSSAEKYLIPKKMIGTEKRFNFSENLLKFNLQFIGHVIFNFTFAIFQFQFQLSISLLQITPFRHFLTKIFAHILPTPFQPKPLNQPSSNAVKLQQTPKGAFAFPSKSNAIIEGRKRRRRP
jgi:hypothetical protein